jgi:hypothetical protein
MSREGEESPAFPFFTSQIHRQERQGGLFPLPFPKKLALPGA